LAGAKSKDIQVNLNISRGALRSTLSLDQLRNQGVSQSRIGAPKSYTEAEERKLIRHVRLHPKDTYTQVKEACALRCGKTTIKKILKEYSIINWRARRRPFLTETNAAKRLAWCKKHKHTTKDEWGRYIWSDEYSVERGRGKRDK